ncbi:MAG: hypothetical protein ABIQ93_14545 [Saprospiraceae bacterium]
MGKRRRLYKRLAFFCWLAGFSLPIKAQTATPPPDVVKIGAYINDIYDVNLSEKSFSVQFWVWFNYDSLALRTDDTLNPLATLEIPNAKDVENDLAFSEAGGERGIWASKKVRATMKKDWDIRHFPFDEQSLQIELEDSNSDTKRMIYQADTLNTKLDPRLSLINWDITHFHFSTDTKTYNTTYGDPSLSGSSVYPHAQLEIAIKRKNQWLLFWSLFTGLYVAFFISSLVFWIDVDQVDPRFGLSVGALFAAVGNKYIVDSILPQSATFTLVDKLHILTYFFLLLCIFLSVLSLRIWKRKSPEQSQRFDQRVFWTVVTIYVVINLVLVLKAVYG